MTHRHFFTAAKTSALACVAVAVAVGLAAAQQAPAPKTQQKAPPAKNQKSAPPPPQQQQAQPEQPKIDFSPWTKVCPKGQEANAKAVCLTGKDGVIETGM